MRTPKIIRDIDLNDAEEIRKLREEHDRLRQDGIIRLRFDLDMPLAHLTVRSYADPDGKELAYQYRDRAKSWTRNMYNWAATQACGAVQSWFGDASGAGAVYGAGSAAVKITGGTVHTGTGVGNPLYGDVVPNGWSVGLGVITRIVVGTGNAAESFDGDPGGFRLDAIVPHGNLANQLFYQAMLDQELESWDAGTRRLTVRHRRIWNNNSGGQIDIREVGWYGPIYSANAVRSCLWCRDLLAAAVPVHDGGQLEVIYDFESYALPA